jgi:hypothetical protein
MKSCVNDHLVSLSESLWTVLAGVGPGVNVIKLFWSTWVGSDLTFKC